LSADTTWKLSLHAPKRAVQAALLGHDMIDDWDFELVIAGREVAEDRPDDWVLEGWYPRKPGKAEKSALAGLFEGKTPPITIEELAPQDWVTLSQHNAPPIRAGRFHVHTPDYPADPEAIDFAIRVFSSEARNAMARAIPSSAEISSKIPSRSSVGMVGISSAKPKVVKVACPVNGPRRR
jgi:hypothetical protein